MPDEDRRQRGAQKLGICKSIFDLSLDLELAGQEHFPEIGKWAEHLGTTRDPRHTWASALFSEIITSLQLHQLRNPYHDICAMSVPWIRIQNADREIAMWAHDSAFSDVYRKTPGAVPAVIAIIDMAVRFQTATGSVLDARYGTDNFFDDEATRFAT